mmetsp:Transcript_26272/g.74754  ORF Transcript_26272/g.74754 Transcript_26272/m.74754 type:complete len:283 (+) Transcript_26272:94-942(+)
MGKRRPTPRRAVCAALPWPPLAAPGSREREGTRRHCARASLAAASPRRLLRRLLLLLLVDEVRDDADDHEAEGQRQPEAQEVVRPPALRDVVGVDDEGLGPDAHLEDAAPAAAQHRALVARPRVARHADALAGAELARARGCRWGAGEGGRGADRPAAAAETARGGELGAGVRVRPVALALPPLARAASRLPEQGRVARGVGHAGPARRAAARHQNRKAHDDGHDSEALPGEAAPSRRRRRRLLGATRRLQQERAVVRNARGRGNGLAGDRRHGGRYGRQID